MSVPQSPAIVAAGQLHDFAVRVARAAGVPNDDAAVIADSMIWAELRGLDIGIGRLAMLVSRIRCGGTIADPQPVVIRDAPAFAVLDGRGAWGSVTAARAMRMAIDRARAAGVGACVVRDTGNSQAMGFYPWLAVQERMIGLAITNSMPLQAPWGGTRRALGNEAYAIGCPSRRHPPVIFDTTTTAMSWLRIHDHHARGDSLPPEVALNEAGEPTTDPIEALAGLLLPAGGHKGFGLTLMWEILTGVLSGGEAFGPSVNGGHNPLERAGQSTFLLAIDPSKSMPYHVFLDRVDVLIDNIHDTPPVPGVERVRFPGERSAETSRTRELHGIPLTAARLDGLRRLARELGVEPPETIVVTR